MSSAAARVWPASVSLPAGPDMDRTASPSLRHIATADASAVAVASTGCAPTSKAYCASPNPRSTWPLPMPAPPSARNSSRTSFGLRLLAKIVREQREVGRGIDIDRALARHAIASQADAVERALRQKG